MPHWCSSIQILYRKQKRHRDCRFLLFMIYVQLVKQKELKFPLHYANAQLQLDGGLYHCELSFCRKWTLSGCDAETTVTVHFRLGVA